MRKSVFIFIALGIIGLVSNEIYSNVNGALAGKSGAPGENNCTQCHSGVLNIGPGNVLLTSDAPGNVYVPGNTYTITATIEQGGITRFGFEVLSAYNALGAMSEGTVVITNATETQQKAAGNKRYVTHKFAGTSGTNTKSWSFDWTAPATGKGDLTFWGAFLGANNSGSTSGDAVYTTSLELKEVIVANDPLLSSDIQLQVYPTIADEFVQIEIENAKLHPVQIAVTAIDGSQLTQVILPAAGTSRQHTLQTDLWSAGIYFVTVQSGDYRETRRVVKQ